MGFTLKVFGPIRGWLSNQAKAVRLAVDGGVGATVIGCWLGVWFSSGDAVIIAGALVFGTIVGLLGIATSNIDGKWKLLLALGMMAVSVADGVFIYRHTHPAAFIRRSPVLPPNMPMPLPPQKSGQQSTPSPGPQNPPRPVHHHRLFVGGTAASPALDTRAGRPTAVPMPQAPTRSAIPSPGNTSLVTAIPAPAQSNPAEEKPFYSSSERARLIDAMQALAQACDDAVAEELKSASNVTYYLRPLTEDESGMYHRYGKFPERQGPDIKPSDDVRSAVKALQEFTSHKDFLDIKPILRISQYYQAEFNDVLRLPELSAAKSDMLISAANLARALAALAQLKTDDISAIRNLLRQPAEQFLSRYQNYRNTINSVRERAISKRNELRTG